MKKGETNIWIIFSFVLAAFLFFLLGTYFPNFLKEKSKLMPSPSVSPSIRVSPTVEIIPTTAILPTVKSELSDLELIKMAMAEKHGKAVSQVELTISKKTETYAQGGVRFFGEEGGGWFLAYKGTDGWIIVQDGNGTISCEIIDPYSFPVDMVSECVDKDGNLVTR